MLKLAWCRAIPQTSFFPDACTNFTMEAWIKPSAFQSRTDVYSPIFSVTTSDKSGYSRYIFGLRQSKLSLFQATVTSGDRFPVSSADVTLNTWTHVAVTHTATEVKFYINGSLDATLTGSFLPPVGEYSNSHLTIGGYHSVVSLSTSSYTTARVFQGSLADVRVWTKARTATEIAAYYDKKATGREDGLIGCWHMDEGYGSKIRNAASGAEQSVAVGGMGLVRGSYLALTGQKQTLETDAQLTTSDFTLEAWVRDVSPTPRLGGNGRGYILSQYQSGKDWLSLCFENSNKLQPGIRISSTWFLPARSSVKKGEWFHIAATREGNSVKLYLNGSLSTNATYTANLGVASSAKLTFGALAGNDGHVGGIREARAWNYARSQVQIQQTMFGGIVGDETGLVGWWPLDQDASATRIWNRKASNTSEKAIPTGAVWDSDGSPLLALPDQGESAEKAANFGGGWFSVARTGIHVDASDFTFETWVRPDAYPFDQSYLFAQYKESESNPSRFLMGIHDSGRFGFFIGGTDGSGNTGGWKETDAPIPLGRWTHLAATRSGSTLKLYVDGALAKTFENYTTLSPWSSAYPHDLTLGGVDGAYAYTSGAYARINNSRSFSGAMREARVWTVARTADEIAESYKRKVHLSDNGLIGYWPLDGADEGGATRLVNLKGGAVGTIVAGWEDVEPLNLRDAPAAFTIIFR